MNESSAPGVFIKKRLQVKGVWGGCVDVNSHAPSYNSTLLGCPLQVMMQLPSQPQVPRQQQQQQQQEASMPCKTMQVLLLLPCNMQSRQQRQQQRH
jgi:hypothetical protein